MEQAQWMYGTANDGEIIQSGYNHDGGQEVFVAIAWLTTLQSYYSNKLPGPLPQ